MGSAAGQSEYDKYHQAAAIELLSLL